MSVGKDVVKNFENLHTGNKNDIAAMENSMLPKKKIKFATQSINSTFGYIPKSITNRLLKRYLHTQIHSSNIHYS